MFSKTEVAFLASMRVARVGTVNIVDKSPHLVPVCFVYDGEVVFTTLSIGSKRLKNVKQGSEVAILVDEYEEKSGEWRVLRGLMIHGDTRVLRFQKNREEFMRGWKSLIQKYPQYRQWANIDLTPKDPDKRCIMMIQPVKVIRWGFE